MRFPDTGRSGSRDLVARATRTRVQARIVRARAASLRSRFASKRKQPPPKLSPREVDVLALVSVGLTTKDVAAQLGISVNTATYHLSNIYRKLGTHSRVAAANEFYARRFAV